MLRNLPKHVPTTEPFSPEIVWQVAIVASWRWTLFHLERWFEGKLRDGWEPISEDKSGIFPHNRLHLVESLPGTAPFRYFFLCVCFCFFFVQLLFAYFLYMFSVFLLLIRNYITISLKNIYSYFFCGARGKKSWTRPENNLTCCKIQGGNRHVQKVYRQHSFAKIMRVS